MREKYFLYFDSGVSNSRAYLLDQSFRIKYKVKNEVGSKDSAIAGSNDILIKGLKELHNKVLENNGLKEEDLLDIYASGMVTSPYGLKEVAHLTLPVTIQSVANSLVPFYEDTCFHRVINLVPGLKAEEEDFSFVNNMRGEEIEIIGAFEALKEITETKNLALILPGSHTHIAYIEGEELTGIISNFTGELFYALKNDTVLSPILNYEGTELDKDMVEKGFENVKRFGFNRALYICHAMRIFDKGTPEQRLSYGEAVIMGGVRQVLEYYCVRQWKDCHTAVIISNQFMYKLFSYIFENSKIINTVLWLPISEEKNYGVNGLKKIVEIKMRNRTY